MRDFLYNGALLHIHSIGVFASTACMPAYIVYVAKYTKCTYILWISSPLLGCCWAVAGLQEAASVGTLAIGSSAFSLSISYPRCQYHSWLLAKKKMAPKGCQFCGSFFVCWDLGTWQPPFARILAFWVWGFVQAFMISHSKDPVRNQPGFNQMFAKGFERYPTTIFRWISTEQIVKTPETQLSFDLCRVAILLGDLYIYIWDIYIYTLGAGGSPGTPAPRVFMYIYIYMKLLHGWCYASNGMGWGWGGVGWGW